MGQPAPHPGPPLPCQVSLRLFELTNVLRNAFVPMKDSTRIAENLVAGALIGGVCYGLAYLSMAIVVRTDHL